MGAKEDEIRRMREAKYARLERAEPVADVLPVPKPLAAVRALPVVALVKGPGVRSDWNGYMRGYRQRQRDKLASELARLRKLAGEAE